MTQSATPGPAGDFALDPDLTRVAIQKLQEVQNRIRAVRADAVKVAGIPQTAHDAISIEAFRVLREKADGGPGSLTWALDGGLEYVQKLIDQLQADLDQVVGEDAAAAHALGAP